MLEVVSKNNIKVKTTAFNGIKEVTNAVELAHSGEMSGKPIVIIDQLATKDQKKSGIEMV
jgi:propanol-preferring alcohol dehydrogenase